MSYASKQGLDVTAVSASLGDAGGGCRIPTGEPVSDKLMSAAQPPRRHLNYISSQAEPASSAELSEMQKVQSNLQSGHHSSATQS